jgi:hypothetical protein
MSQLPIVFHEAQPENLKAAYSPFDQVNFSLSNEGRSMVVGSIHLEGVLAVVQGAEAFGATATSSGDLVYYDRFVGAHSVIDQMTVEAGGQTLETIPNYPRLVKSLVTGSESQTTMFLSHNVCELKCPGDEIAREILMGNRLPEDSSAGGAVPAVERVNLDFSIRPVCVLNGAMSGAIPYRRSGNINVSINLARIADVFWGPQVGAGTSYTLSDLRMTWRSVPDNGKNDPVSLTRYLGIKQSIQSSNAALQLRVPAVCDSMFMTFLPHSAAGQLIPNTTACTRPPEVSRVQYLFSDSTNRLITYQLRTELEILEKYVDALNNGSDTSAVTLRNVKNSETYGLGLSFDGQLDLNRNKLSVIIESAISNAEPFEAFAFFRSTLMV